MGSSSGILRIGKVDTKDNLIDVLAKMLTAGRRYDLFYQWMY